MYQLIIGAFIIGWCSFVFGLVVGGLWVFNRLENIAKGAKK